jgi:hypothetical protein
MVPAYLWRAWWKKGNMRAEDDQLIFSNGKRPSAKGTPLILEGTGFLEPRPVPSAEEPSIKREELMQKMLEKLAPTGFRGARKMFHYRRDRRSPFYQTFQLLFTNYFVRGQAEGTPMYICFAVCHPARHSIGVSFEEFVRNGEVALWAEPALNPVEDACIRDSMKDMYPMPPLEAPVNLEPPHEERDRMMRLHRPPTSIPGTVPVEWYLKSALCTPERIDAIERAMRGPTLRKILRGSTANYEAVTLDLHGWRLVVYLDGNHTLDEYSLRRMKQEDGTTPPEEEGDGDDDAF